MTPQYCTVCTECTIGCVKLQVVAWANQHLQAIPCYRLT